MYTKGRNDARDFAGQMLEILHGVAAPCGDMRAHLRYPPNLREPGLSRYTSELGHSGPLLRSAAQSRFLLKAPKPFLSSPVRGLPGPCRVVCYQHFDNY